MGKDLRWMGLWKRGPKATGRHRIDRAITVGSLAYIRGFFLAVCFLPSSAMATSDLSGFNPLPFVEQTRITQGPYAGGYLIAPYGYLNWYFVNLGLIPFVHDIPDHVKIYLNLYIKNLTPQFNIRDVVFDFDKGGTTGPVQFQRQDSDDSYAATFLSLAVTYTRATGDTAWFNANSQTLKKIADNNLINSEYPSSGLTHVFQQQSLYDVAYLEDNCEVYRGMKDFANYLSGINDQDAVRYQQAASRIAQGIAGLFNPAAQNFWVSSDHEKVGNTFYPDTASQIYPQVWGVPLGAATAAMETAGYNYLNAATPGWEHRLYDPYPWVIVGYAAALRGDNPKALAKMQQMRELLNSQRGVVTINELGFYKRITDLWARQAKQPAPISSPVHPQPPVALPGMNRRVSIKQWVILTGQARAFSPAHIVSYQWQQVSGPPVAIYRISNSSIKFRAPSAPGQLVLRLTVTDSYGQTGRQIVKVIVQGNY